MAAEGMQSHDQSCGNCPTASHPATKKGRINKPILPKPARCAKSDRLLARGLPLAGLGAGLDRLVGERVQRHARVRRERADLRVDLPDVAQFAERRLPVE